jgi:hypothetical protein
MTERLCVDYGHTRVYYETDLNAVGATDSLTLRPAPAAPGANDAYVKKYGTPYPATDVTGAVKVVPRGAAGNVGTYRIYAAEGGGTLLGTVTDSGVSNFGDGGVVAANTDVFIVLTCGVGAYTCNNGDVLQIGTDIDVALNVILSGETVSAAAGNAIIWYVSSSGSTYYESTYRYGGARHTPVLASAKYPYFDPFAAYTACAAGVGTIVEVIDSEFYANHTGTDFDIGVANFDIHSASGYTPTIKCNVGAATTRFLWERNNSNAIYVNENGNDADAGTWQAPKLTLNAAWVAAAGARDVVYGGFNATVNGALYNETLTMNAAHFLLVEEGYLPRITYTVPWVINVTAANAGVAGWTFVGGYVQINGAANFQVFDCTFEGGAGSALFVNAVQLNLVRCDLRNCVQDVTLSGACTLVATHNFFHASTNGISLGGANSAGNITDNVFYDLNCGIFGAPGIDYTGTLEHNLFYRNYLGIFVQVALTATIDYCIFVAHESVGINTTGASAGDWNCFWDNTVDFGGFYVDGGNSRFADPRLAAPVSTGEARHLGPTANSAAVVSAVTDIGPRLRIFDVSQNGLNFDGIIFDGGDTWFNAIHWDSNRTGTTVSWCTFQHFGGMALNVRAVAAGGHTFNNLLFSECGSAINDVQGGNTTTECAAMWIDRIGFYYDQTNGHVITHLSVGSAEYGVYFGSLAAGIQFADSVIGQCTQNSVYSEVYVFLTYVCVESDVSLNVDISDPSNMHRDPLFIWATSDLHLRTIENGFPFDSPAKDAASDGYDMGAYLMARGLTDEGYRTYGFELDSIAVDEPVTAKGPASFETSDGKGSMAAKAFRRGYKISWDGSSAMTPTFRAWIEYLASQIPNDDQGVTELQAVLRLSLRPVTYQYGPEAGVVDDNAETITVAGAGLVPNRWRGFDATVRHSHHADGVLDAVNHTLTVGGGPWGTDEWAGYWFRQQVTEACGAIYDHHFKILSNNANVLTFSDPFGLAVTVAAGFVFDIESDHKILSHDEEIFCVEDEDWLLRDGTFDFIIDHFRCRVSQGQIQSSRGGRWSPDETRYPVIPDALIVEEA